MTKSSDLTLNVGLIGCGVVGGGVASALLGQNRPWEQDGIKIKVIRAADIRWPKDSAVPPPLRTKSISKIIEDPNIDVIVELVGGTTLAYDVVDQALDAGKHVVTANKALLAERGSALFKKAKKKNLEIAFEAAVAGAIPILQSIQTGFAANDIQSIFGILNGTTNFILTRMSKTGAKFDDALAEAQSLGFAEADPTLDVEGIDAAHKIQLLAALAFGKNVPMDKIPVRGIRRVDPLDIAYADQLGCCIKLLAVASEIKEGFEIGVGPTLVPNDHSLASVHNEVNAVFVEGNLTGASLLVGKGAGRYPTASAVIADIISMAQTGCRANYVTRMVAAKKATPLSPDKFRSRYYLRIAAAEKPGVLAKVTDLLGKAGISISSVVQLGELKTSSRHVPIALLTHETTKARIQTAVRKIHALSVIKSKPVVFPFVQ